MQFEHYLIRVVNMDDLQDYYELIAGNRKRLEDFFAGTVAITQNLADTRTHLLDVTGKWAEQSYYPFVVADTDTGRLIASIQVKNMDKSIPKAELGYYIDTAYEGKGIITKAMQLVIAYCFDELKLAKLLIRTYEGNIGSRRIAEKNGFKLEGIIRRDYKTTGGMVVDSMYYGLINDEYLAG